MGTATAGACRHINCTGHRWETSPHQVCSDEKVDGIVAKVKKHFHPIRSVIVERFNFNSRCQEEATFMAELKVSEFCNYR